MEFAIIDITSESDKRLLQFVEGAIPKIACLGLIDWLQEEREINKSKNKMVWSYLNKMPVLNIDDGKMILLLKQKSKIEGLK